MDGIDVVITDARMPQMSGFQFARRIKELRSTTRIILCSAFDINKSEFEKVMPNTRIDGFLTKPFALNELVEVISSVDKKE